jgi:hypothetical protein
MPFEMKTAHDVAQMCESTYSSVSDETLELSNEKAVELFEGEQLSQYPLSP